MARPRLADLFVMRALGASRRELAAHFRMTEPDVRELLRIWGEPARLQPRRWRMDNSCRPPGLEVARTHAARTHDLLER